MNSDEIQKSGTDRIEFRLQSFFPYLARKFYSQVSGAVSGIYSQQFDMKPYEWRTMAILGQHANLTASEVVAASSMDKVSVSRAISAMRKRGWIIERIKSKDARSRVLNLSEAGLKVYDTLYPQMLELERQLLSDLTKDEVATLEKLMEKVELTAKHYNGKRDSQ